MEKKNFNYQIWIPLKNYVYPKNEKILVKFKNIFFIILCLCTVYVEAQSIEVISFNNPLEVSPLLGGELTVDIKYTSEFGATSNNFYIGLHELDENNQFVRKIDGVDFVNQTAGTDVSLSANLFVGVIHPLSNELEAGHYYQITAKLYTNTWNELASTDYLNTSSLETVNEIPYNFSTFPISKGVDISSMTEMESEGISWQDNDGNPRQLMPLLKDYDLDAVRLRVWVDPDNSPANGWCDIDDMVTKAQLADAEGMNIMICTHFSDHWADPGQQTKPAAWANFSVSQLETAVANHITDILNALAAVNITPQWVQIGNETNDGMLWDNGKASIGGFSNYAKFINAGSNAVKTFDASIKTILHLSNGHEQGMYNWNIGGLINNGLNSNNIDIIGMSLYPQENNWKDLVDQTYDNMINIKNTYNKDTILVEIGFSNSRLDITYQYIVYMIERVRQAQGLGVFYWEPIAHQPFTFYPNGAWNEDGSPSVAMDAFLDGSTTLSISKLDLDQYTLDLFPNPSSQQLNIKLKDLKLINFKIYNLRGQLIKSGDFDNNINQSSINIHNINSGVYLLRINDLNTLKFIKK